MSNPFLQKIGKIFKKDSKLSDATSWIDSIGEIKTVSTKIGEFSRRTFSFDTSIDGIQETAFSGNCHFEYKMRKIPRAVFNAITEFFVKVYSKCSGEAYVVITYSLSKDEFAIKVPEQTVSGASVNFEISDMSELASGDEYIVMNVHSHNVMQAFWSGTDDADDSKLSLAGVIGTITTTPVLKMRAAFAKGIHQDLSASEIIDETIDDANLYAISDTELEKVKTRTYGSYPYGGYGGYAYGYGNSKFSHWTEDQWEEDYHRHWENIYKNSQKYTFASNTGKQGSLWNWNSPDSDHAPVHTNKFGKKYSPTTVDRALRTLNNNVRLNDLTGEDIFEMLYQRFPELYDEIIRVAYDDICEAELSSQEIPDERNTDLGNDSNNPFLR